VDASVVGDIARRVRRQTTIANPNPFLFLFVSTRLDARAATLFRRASNDSLFARTPT